mgnify:FL=1
MTKRTESRGKRKHEPWQGATRALLVGCVAELYLLLIHKYYIYGNLDQFLAWDSYLRVSRWLWLGVTVLGGVLLYLCRKKPGWKRAAAGMVLELGAFAALTGILVSRFGGSPIALLAVAVPAAALMAMLWYLYDRECAWGLIVLGLDLAVLWICRKGMGNFLWEKRVLVGAVIFLICLAVLAFLTAKLAKSRGMLGKLRLLGENFDTMPIYAACGVSAVTTVLALVSSAAAYYCIYIVAVLLFALAVYYAIRQL